MAATPAVLFSAKFAENAQTTQYTSNLVQTSIDKFTATNVTGLAATITVNLVASGDVAGTSNMVVITKTIPAGKSYTFPEVVGHILAAGGFISTIAGTASAIVIRASGRQYS